MTAARTGNVEAMKVLVDRGADVNAKETARGTTPLMWAADEGHPAAVKLLIERGADIAARSNPAQRGRGPALGKANDPRKAVAAQGAALAAGAALDLRQIREAAGEVPAAGARPCRRRGGACGRRTWPGSRTRQRNSDRCCGGRSTGRRRCGSGGIREQSASA